MKTWQRAVHGTLMMTAALNVVQDFVVVQPALAQQAVTIQGSLPAGSNALGTVTVGNANTNGQATLASSSPVAPASNWINDACFGTNAKTQTAISSALGSAQLVAGVSGKKIYVCSAIGIVGAAINLSFIEGTGTTCSSPTADLGSTGAAGGMPIAANGGFTFGGGAGTAFQTQNASATLCMLQSGTTLVAGGLAFVQQ